MKHLLSTFTVLFVLNGYAQDYNLKISAVSNQEEAKQVTDLIRSVINDAEEPFKYYPHFNDDNDTFEFESSMVLNREIFEEKFATIGHEVLEFKRIEKLTPISN